MGCAFTKQSKTPWTELEDDNQKIVVGEVVEAQVIEGKCNIYDKTNMTRFRNLDDTFCFSPWNTYGTRTTRFTPEIKHCVHDIRIRINQTKVGAKIMTTVVFQFPNPFLESMPVDLKSMKEIDSLYAKEYKDCVDVIEYASQQYPEMEEVKPKILSIAFPDNVKA